MPWKAVGSSFRASARAFHYPRQRPRNGVSRRTRIAANNAACMTNLSQCDDEARGFGADLLSVRLQIDFAAPALITPESEGDSVTSGCRDLRSEGRHQRGTA